MNKDPDARCESCGELLGLGVTHCWSCLLPLSGKCIWLDKKRLSADTPRHLAGLYGLVCMLYDRVRGFRHSWAPSLELHDSPSRWKAWWWVKGVFFGIKDLKDDLEKAFLPPREKKDGQKGAGECGENTAAPTVSELAAWLDRYAFPTWITSDCSEEPMESLAAMKTRLILWLGGKKHAVVELLEGDPRWLRPGW